MKELSLSDRFILGAIDKGYTADPTGLMFAPDGKEIGRRQQKQSGHLSVTVYVKDINTRNFQSILVHRFVAAYLLGAEALTFPCIRHLNDIPDDNRIANLCPGTKSQNRRDIPKERLSAIGKANAPTLIARSRKLSDLDIVQLREQRQLTGASYADLAKQFGIAPMTAFRAITHQSWSNIT